MDGGRLARALTVTSAHEGRAQSETLAGEAARAVVLTVVATVTRVVSDHRPARHAPQRDREDRQGTQDRVGRPHGQQAEGAARVGPQAHLFQMRDVGLALLALELVAERANLLLEAVIVKFQGPPVRE